MYSKDANNDYTQKVALKINPDNGEIIWHKKHDKVVEFAGYDNSIEGDSNELYIKGRSITENHRAIYTLTRLTPEGDTVWMNAYTYPGAYGPFHLWDFIRTPDKGFILCGDVVPNGSNQDVWVIKVDSNGCSNPQCDSRVYDVRLGVNYLKELATEFRVFPNPANDWVSIETSSPLDKEWSYVFLDNMGKEVLKGKMQNAKPIDVKHLPSGVYVLQLQSGPVVKSYKVVVK